MKKVAWYAGIFLFLLLGAFFTSGTAYASDIRLWVNGSELRSEPSPRVVNERMLIPVVFVKEGMKMNVGWDSKTRRVTIKNHSKKVELVIDSKLAKVNGSVKTLDAAPIVIQDRTYLPFRALGKLLGLNVGWEQETQHIILNPPVRLHIQEHPVHAMIYHIKDGYFVVAKQMADVTGYQMKQSNHTLIFKKGIDVRTLKWLNGANGYRRIDNQFVIPLTYAAALGDGNGSWNKDKTQYTVSKKPQKSTKHILNQGTIPTGVLSSKDKVTLVIDAGHGGKDAGAIGVNNAREKDFTLAIVQKLAANLRKESDVKVVLTRDGDTYPTLTDRVNIANRLKADLFLSVHANSGPPSANGTETYYYSDQSKSFAEIVHAHLIKATGFFDRQVKTAGFQVIKYTKMPSTLVEVGFITNPGNNEQMMDDDFRQRVADGLYDAIMEYCQKNE